MNEYDAALKTVLRRIGGRALRELTGFSVERWHNVEFSEVRDRRVDLLGETADDRLIHVELQSTNDPDMALRMAEYSYAIFRQFRRFPEQSVLYVGMAPLRMESRLAGPHGAFECPIRDVREFDAEPLLASNSLEDNVIAVLLRLPDERGAVRRILERIGASPPEDRGAALAELMIFAGLRNLEEVLDKEKEHMPLTDDIRDHKIIGREYRRGELRIIRPILEGRFGPVPDWAEERLLAMTWKQLEEVGDRLLDARSLEDLFG